MDPVSIFLLTVAGIFLVGIIGEIVFQKTSVPDVIWLIAIGALLGPISGLVSRPMLEGVAPFFGALTLVVVLFEGGSQLRLAELGAAAPRASALAVLGFFASMIAVAGVVMLGIQLDLLPDNWTLMHGLTMGAILGGSSSVVIMPAMSKAKLSPRLSNLVNLESALTDVLCVVATVACIEIVLSGSTDPKVVAMTVGRSFGIGMGIGTMVGLVSLLFLRSLKRSEYAYPALLSVLLLLYVFVSELGGSAALSILAAAVIVGNAPALSRRFGLSDEVHLGRGVKHVHTQLAFIIKSFFFTFIGAMLGPPVSKMLIGVLLAFTLLAVRVPVTGLSLLGGNFSRPAKNLVTITLPRGMAAGVLAMLPHHAGVSNTADLPVMAFASVVTTILLFSLLFPIVKKRLGPEDRAPEAPVPVTRTLRPSEIDSELVSVALPVSPPHPAMIVPAMSAPTEPLPGSE